MCKPKLYIMVGLSGSGKSTIAKELSVTEDCEIVSSDEIRGEICKGGVADQSQNQEVFRIFHKRIVDLLREGKNVIADATNISIKSRRYLLSFVYNIDCFKIAYIVPKSIERCIEDNIDREYPVPHHVIQKQMMNFQVPFIEEGFDRIIIHKFDKEYDISFEDIFYKMEGFNQNNPHHNMTLDQHCLKTFWWFSKSSDVLERGIERGVLIHDIGKLFTQKIDENGIAHYYQHENVGSYYILSNYNNLGKEKEVILNTCFIVNYHMLPMNWDTEKTEAKWRGIFGDQKFEMLKFLMNATRQDKEDIVISDNGFVSYSEYEDLLERYKEIKEWVEECLKQDLYVVTDFTDFKDDHEFEIELSKNQLEKLNELKELLGYTMEDVFIEKVEKYEEGMF